MYTPQDAIAGGSANQILTYTLHMGCPVVCQRSAKVGHPAEGELTSENPLFLQVLDHHFNHRVDCLLR